MLESIRQIYAIMQSLLRNSLTWTWGARPSATLRRIPPHSRLMTKREYATKGGEEPFWLPHKGNVTDLDVTVSSRNSTLRSKPFEEFKAVGVSFNHAQSALATVREGDAVLMARQPDNPYDSDAVRITSLDGRHLGYIARTETHLVTQPLVNGCVLSIGESQSGLLGFRLACQPGIRCVGLTAAPAPLLSWLSIDTKLAGPVWEALQDRELKPGSRCHLSGAPALKLVADWEVLDTAKTLRLAGFLPVTETVATILTAPSLSIQMMEVLASLNKWSLDEAEIYHRAHIFQVAQRGAQSGWKVDASVLVTLGLDLPDM